MGVFVLKVRDTRPVFEVALKNPNGTAHDLTGSTAWKLHIQLSPTVTLTRDLVKEGADALGVLRYTWVDTDWAPVVPTDPKLPVPPSVYQTLELPMEYEVSAAAARLTFPNGGYDKLQIRGDLA